MKSIPHTDTYFPCVLIQVSSCRLLKHMLSGWLTSLQRPAPRRTRSTYSIHTSVFRKKGLQFYMPHFPYLQHQEDIFLNFVGLRGHIFVWDVKGKVLASKINTETAKCQYIRYECSWNENPNFELWNKKVL